MAVVLGRIDLRKCLDELNLGMSEWTNKKSDKELNSVELCPCLPEKVPLCMTMYREAGAGLQVC